MKQQLLPYPVAKNKDPISSFKAREEFHKSGKAESHRKRIMGILRSHNGSTGKKIAVKTGLKFEQVARRMSELRAKGEVINCKNCQLNLYSCKGGGCAFPIYENNLITWWVR